MPNNGLIANQNRSTGIITKHEAQERTMSVMQAALSKPTASDNDMVLKTRKEDVTRDRHGNVLARTTRSVYVPKDSCEQALEEFHARVGVFEQARNMIEHVNGMTESLEHSESQLLLPQQHPSNVKPKPVETQAAIAHDVQ